MCSLYLLTIEHTSKKMHFHMNSPLSLSLFLSSTHLRVGPTTLSLSPLLLLLVHGGRTAGAPSWQLPRRGALLLAPPHLARSLRPTSRARSAPLCLFHHLMFLAPLTYAHSLCSPVPHIAPPNTTPLSAGVSLRQHVALRRQAAMSGRDTLPVAEAFSPPGRRALVAKSSPPVGKSVTPVGCRAWAACSRARLKGGAGEEAERYQVELAQ
jgi:hypothetical protein